ncbi:MAG: ABC transporter ATP-binding protein [Candidatus Hermodarchaeota archaeon]|nr:ABC transporter ATP-binding protein [Candidatus Hermodarchaeota archaeon]
MSSANSATSDSSKISLQIRDLSFTYQGSRIPALNLINLNIRAGEFVVIAGPSGSGKSTLSRCLTGFIPHEYPGEFHGSVMVFDQDTQTTAISDLARTISLIQQDPDSQLVTLKVLDEVAFGPENFLFPPEDIQSKIELSLQAISASQLHSRNTYTLSGGEKQKIVIAAFLAIQPPILILDEPTSRLDPATALDVVNTLSRLHQDGVTIFVVEHRIQPFLPYATRVLLLNDGNLHFNGTPEQLQTQPNTLIELGVALHPSIFHDASTSRPIIAHQERLEVTNLTYTYAQTETLPEQRPAIKDLNFAIKPGEIVALMGANGSGKSTLLMQLMGLLKPDTGTIKCDGHTVHDQPVSKIARSIGYVFQNPLHQLFASTVWDEILLASHHLGVPSPTQAHAQAEKYLETFGLLPYRDQSPFSLSLGEQRRLTIASVLLHHPKLLLLDEPFIGQDYWNVHQLMEVLAQMAHRDTSILLATHDMAIVETYCHRVLFLHSGQLLIDAPIPQGLHYLSRLGTNAYRTDLTTKEVANIQ